MKDLCKKINSTPRGERDIKCNGNNKERSVRVVVEAFEDQWDGVGDFIEEYRKWIPTSIYSMNSGIHPSKLGLKKYITEEHEREASKELKQERKKFKKNEKKVKVDATYGQMFSDIASSINTISRSGIKIVTNEEHAARYTICMKCEYLTKHKRCTKCGCFMKLKSRFAAMSCPVGLWLAKK